MCGPEWFCAEDLVYLHVRSTELDTVQACWNLDGRAQAVMGAKMPDVLQSQGEMVGLCEFMLAL